MSYACNYEKSYKQTIERIKKTAKKEKETIRLLADISRKQTEGKKNV